MGFLSRHGIIAAGQVKAKVAPVYVGNAFGTGKTVSLPTHQTGDLLIVAITGYFNNGGATAPGGWTVLLNTTPADNGILCYKVAASSGETCVWTSTKTWNTANTAICVRGANPTTPINVYALGAIRTYDYAGSLPTVTTTVDKTAILNIDGTNDMDGFARCSAITNAALSSIVKISDQTNGNGGCVASFATKDVAGVVGATAYTFTQLTAEVFQATIAINPL